MNNGPRILVTRLGHIGDCVLTLPLVNALREQLPGAYLGWVVERPSHQLLEGHAAIDRLFVLRRSWLKSWRGLTDIRRELREARFDIALDPQSLTKSALLARLSGAPQRIGFAAPRGRELSRWLNRELVSPRHSHVLDATLELLGPLHVDRPPVRFALPHWPAAAQKVAAFVAQSHLGGGFAAINPGAGWASRRWPPARFGQVARHLGRTHQLPSVVVWAGDAEKAMADEIVATSGGHAIAAPPTTLVELTELLRATRCLVTGDSGPMHIAAAVGTRCVALYGTTRPEDSGAWGPGHQHVQRFYQAGTSRERRGGANTAMQAISADEVAAACDRLLRELGRARSTRQAA